MIHHLPGCRTGCGSQEVSCCSHEGKHLYLYEYCGLVEKSPDIATEVNEKESADNHKEVQSEAVTVKSSDRSAGEKKKSIHDRLKENKEKLGQKSGKDNPQKGVELT